MVLVREEAFGRIRRRKDAKTASTRSRRVMEVHRLLHERQNRSNMFDKELRIDVIQGLPFIVMKRNVNSDSFSGRSLSVKVSVTRSPRCLWCRMTRSRKMPSGSWKMPAGNPTNPRKYRKSLMSSRIRFSHPLLGRGWKHCIYQCFQFFDFLDLTYVVSYVVRN